MARLRVGDIEIDGDSIVIGGRVMTGPGAAGAASGQTVTHAHSAGSAHAVSATTVHVGGAAASAAEPSDTEDGTAWERLPRPQVLVAAGSAAMAGGLLALGLAAGPLDLWAAFFGGGFLVPVGAGTIGLGLLKHRAQRRALACAREREARALSPHLAPLRGLLRERGGRHATVEWLAAELGQPEAIVVRSLAHLREAGEVVEDLDVDTGEWFYALSDEAARPLALDERLRALESQPEDGDAGTRSPGHRSDGR